jgi:hypothetical protein
VALTRVLGVGEKCAEGEAELLRKDEKVAPALALATAPALALPAVLPVLLGTLLRLPVALGPLGMALGRGEREALALAVGEALARALAVPVPVLNSEEDEAGERETVVVALAVAQAAAVLLGRPALPLGDDVAATLALRVVSLLCDCEAAPLPLGLPEGELEAEEE